MTIPNVNGTISAFKSFSGNATSCSSNSVSSVKNQAKVPPAPAAPPVAGPASIAPVTQTRLPGGPGPHMPPSGGNIERSMTHESRLFSLRPAEAGGASTTQASLQKLRSACQHRHPEIDFPNRDQTKAPGGLQRTISGREPDRHEHQSNCQSRQCRDCRSQRY